MGNSTSFSFSVPFFPLPSFFSSYYSSPTSLPLPSSLSIEVDSFIYSYVVWESIVIMLRWRIPSEYRVWCFFTLKSIWSHLKMGLEFESSQVAFNNGSVKRTTLRYRKYSDSRIKESTRMRGKAQRDGRPAV